MCVWWLPPVDTDFLHWKKKKVEETKEQFNLPQKKNQLLAMADICEVDTHISKRYDVKKRLGKGVRPLQTKFNTTFSLFSFLIGFFFYCLPWVYPVYPFVMASHYSFYFTPNSSSYLFVCLSSDNKREKGKTRIFLIHSQKKYNKKKGKKYINVVCCSCLLATHSYNLI